MNNEELRIHVANTYEARQQDVEQTTQSPMTSNDSRDSVFARYAEARKLNVKPEAFEQESYRERTNYQLERMSRIINNEKNPFKKRLLTTRLSALYFLLYNNDPSGARKSESIFKESGGEEVDQLEQHVDLAIDFLNKTETKNKEQTFAASSRVTMGIEIEFWGLGKQLQRRLEAYQKASTESSNPKYERMIKTLEYVLGDYAKRDLSGKEVDPIVIEQCKLGIFNQRNEMNVFEITTNPSASPRTWLREILMAHKLGGLSETIWGVHESFGGVQLNSKDTRLMDGFLIATAAGLIPNSKYTDQQVEKIMRGKMPTIREKFPKRSFDSITSNIVYFPFHRVRSPGGIEEYTPQFPEDQVVELRSFHHFSPGEYTKFVKQATFMYLFAAGVSAAQTEPFLRTEEQEKLVGAYQEMVTEWNNILTAYKLGTLDKPEDYYLKPNYDYPPPEDDEISTIPYVRLRDRLGILSQLRPDFSRKIRKMIRHYQKEARKYTGYGIPRSEKGAEFEQFHAYHKFKAIKSLDNLVSTGTIGDDYSIYELDPNPGSFLVSYKQKAKINSNEYFPDNSLESSISSDRIVHVEGKGGDAIYFVLYNKAELDKVASKGHKAVKKWSLEKIMRLCQTLDGDGEIVFLASIIAAHSDKEVSLKNVEVLKTANMLGLRSTHNLWRTRHGELADRIITSRFLDKELARKTRTLLSIVKENSDQYSELKEEILSEYLHHAAYRLSRRELAELTILIRSLISGETPDVLVSQTPLLIEM